MVTTSSITSMVPAAALPPGSATAYRGALPKLLEILAPVRKHLDVPYFVQWADGSVTEVRASEVCRQEIGSERLFLLRSPGEHTRFGFFRACEVQWERPKIARGRPGRFLVENTEDGPDRRDDAWEQFPVSRVFNGIAETIRNERIKSEQRTEAIRAHEQAAEEFLASVRAA